ncbi:hypothetical protein ABIB49_001086 [Arthrobacter sp. UYCu512]
MMTATELCALRATTSQPHIFSPVSSNRQP